MNDSAFFHENRIVFSFGVISDWHIKSEEEKENPQKLLDAFFMLQRLALTDDPNGISLILAPGDLTNDGTDEQTKHAAQVWSTIPSEIRPPLIPVLGNHEKHTENAHLIHRSHFAPFLPTPHEHFPDSDSDGFCHYIIGGYHFLTMDLAKYNKKEPCHYSESAKQHLKQTLTRLTEEAPLKPIFFLNHLPPYATCYGSHRGCFYGSEELLPILSDFPQVIAIVGHLHYPLNDERAIMQTDFTTVEAATIYYMLIDGQDCDNILGGKVDDRFAFSQGLLIQIDDENQIRIKRLDFYRHAEIQSPWLLPAPCLDRSHLLAYPENRHPNFVPDELQIPKAPHLLLSSAENASACTLTLTFPAVRCKRPVRAYRVQFYDPATDRLLRTYKHLSDFYRFPDPICASEQEICITIPDLPLGDYRLTLTALDCFENEGLPLTLLFNATFPHANA